MNHDEFEKRLQRQALKGLPPTWRVEILAAAREKADARPSTPEPRPSWLSTLNHQLSTLLWPSPAAWAGVAAAWLVIGALNHAASLPGATGSYASRPLISPEVMRIVAVEQQRIMREVMGGEAPAADAPRPTPGRPRSALAPITLVV